MSGFPRPREPQQAHSLIATPPIEAYSSGSGGKGRCWPTTVALLFVIALVAFLGNVKINKVLKQSALNGQKAATAIAAADAARRSTLRWQPER
jgi:hypothetical protein